MRSVHRSRLAAAALIGVFLIPVGLSSLRGLTHLLVCAEETDTPFTLVVPPDGEATTMLSLQTIERDDDDALCGGLTVDMRAQDAGPSRVAMTVPVSNHTDQPWQGTVRMHIDNTVIPLRIGAVGPGETATDTVRIDLAPGDTHLNGALMIGP